MVMLNPFQPVCLLFKLFHTDTVEKSDDLSVSFIPSCLCFSPPSHPSSSWSQKFSDEISILFMWYFFILFLQCSYPVIYREDAQELPSSSFFCSQILPVDVIQDFGVDLILFLISQCFLIPVHQLIILLLLFISGELKISQKILNSILIPFKLFWALSSYSSHLIQPVHYLLSNLSQRWFL